MKTSQFIDILARLGVLILLFEVGLESTVPQMMQVGVPALAVATLGVVTPFALGWLVSIWLLPDASEYVHAFIGATLTATSVGITARVLQDLGQSKSREARIILGAAVIDDVLGLVVLAVAAGAITAADQGTSISAWEIAWLLGKALGFLGLALALADAMGLKEHEQTVEYLVDLVVAVQTVRTCIVAAERDPQFTPAGYCYPNHRHLAPGGIALFKARQRISELLRIIPGSSLVVAPADSDLATPELAAGLEDSFGGGGYTAKQRVALLQLAADHVSSALDGRESAFELHASGGHPNWRGWLRQNFRDYNELANAVLQAIDLPMPEVDVSAIPAMPIARRRPTTPPTDAGKS